MAKGYRSQNQFNYARSIYNEILQRNPLAFEALVALSQMEMESTVLMKSIDIRKIQAKLQHQLVDKKIDIVKNSREIYDLQENLVNGHCSTTRVPAVQNVLTSFATIQNTYPLNLHALQQTALTYTRNGNYGKAKQFFEKVNYKINNTLQ